MLAWCKGGPTLADRPDNVDQNVNKLADNNLVIRTERGGLYSKTIVVISDTHNCHRLLNMPPGDILIHCGDITKHKSGKSELREFNTWLGTLPYQHKIVIGGNHDKNLAGLTKAQADAILSNARYLLDEEVQVEGLRIYGSPWHVVRNRYLFWRAYAFGAPIDSINRKWEAIPAGIDILVTHCPPAGVADLDWRGGPTGSGDLYRQVTERIRPKLHLFGHNHDANGIYSHSGIFMINAASMIAGQDVRPPLRFTLQY